jgi:hypothetical protein
MECKNGSLKIKGVCFINPKDYVYDKDGHIERLKRKQKGFDRAIIYIKNEQ